MIINYVFASLLFRNIINRFTKQASHTKLQATKDLGFAPKWRKKNKYKKKGYGMRKSSSPPPPYRIIGSAKN